MPKRTITKILAFVIFASLTFFGMTGCSFLSPDSTAQTSSADNKSKYYEPKIVGRIESDEINEGSGLAASKCQPDVFWTHNDSGDGSFIFAISREGHSLGIWKIRNAKNVDWEDMAAFKNNDGKCFVYVGDIGNNKLDRGELNIYSIAEPTVEKAGKSSTRKNPLYIDQVENLTFSYPDFRHNAETLLVHPVTGAIYVVTKRISGPAGVYKIKPNFDAKETQVAEKVSEISVPAVPNGLFTGGDISPDGTRVVLCDYFSGYEFILPSGSQSFDEIWMQKPGKFDIGNREFGESIAFTSDGNAVIASSEKKHPPIYKATRRSEP